MQFTQTNPSQHFCCHLQSVPLHSKVVTQPVPEHHFFSYICQQEITKVNDISQGKEQDQALIVLSMLI